MFSKSTATLFVALFTLLSASLSQAAINEGYYRSPSLAENTLVFSAEGDLWVAALGENEARRLTSHPALETQALISPDASQVAFIANYDGVREIYTVPVSGGVPKRITYEHANISLQQWIDSETLLYSSTARPGPPTSWTLKQANTNTLETADIPVADAFSGALDSTSDTLFFVQFGIQIATDNTNYYRGGMRGKLWRHNLEAGKEATPLLTDHNANIRDPFVYANRVYFVSDESGRDNLWSADFDGNNLQQITEYSDWSVREIAVDQLSGQVVYRLGADLYIRSLQGSAAQSRKLPIAIHSDHPELRPRWIKTPLEHLTSITYAGEIDRVVFTARGKMAIAGTDQSRLVQVNTPTNSRSRDGHLSPDGQWVYVLSDRSGEVEVWRIAADGSDEAEQLTNTPKRQQQGFKGNLQLSNTGRWASFTDGLGALWLLDTESGKSQRVIEQSDYFEPFGELGWSSDDSHFAVAHTPAGEFRPRILLYQVADGRQAYVTSGKYISRAPQFSPDGDWLYFLSERNFAPSPTHPWFDRDFGTAFRKRLEVFAIALNAEADFPFNAPTELSLAAAREETESETDDKDEKEDESTDAPSMSVSWGDLAARLYQVPVPPDEYYQLRVNDKRLYLVAEAADSSVVKSTEISTTPKLKTFADGVSGLRMSPDGKRLLAIKPDPAGHNHQFMIVPAGEKLPDDLSNKVVKTGAWQFQIDPQDEWRQIFHDAWLMHREMFFDPNMRGVDWLATKEKYAPLLDRITSRDELNDIFKQMMGELNALHSQVYGGDMPEDPNATAPGLLGAVLANHTRRSTAAGVTIERIYRHDVEQPDKFPPLARANVDAQAGDVIVAINGQPVTNLQTLYSALQNQVGKQVLLDLDRKGDRVQTVVVPNDRRTEAQYRYHDWAEGNREYVEQTDGKLGYLHLQSMVGRDVASFVTDFYASHNKQGIIIDVRRNNGGNVDSWLLNHLMREFWAFWQPRLSQPYPNMQQVFRGHLVVLADERTYSDGESFTAGIKALGIADVIGRRTAGAGVWLSGQNGQTDGGMARVAESPVFNPDGHWVIEGYGVSPTIEVINYPSATYQGTDAQLDRAVQYLQDKIKQAPVAPLQTKPYPDGLAPAADVPAGN